MKDTINKLRATAHGNIKEGQHPMDAGWNDQTGVLLSNQQALDIANALEYLTAPPLVLAAIVILQLASESERFPKYDWAAIDHDGGLFLYESRPRLDGVVNRYWVTSEGSDELSLGETPVFRKIDHEQMIFFRSAKGWEWVGDKQEVKGDGHAENKDTGKHILYPLFAYLHDELNVIATDTQMWDIIEIVRKIEKDL